MGKGLGVDIYFFFLFITLLFSEGFFLCSTFCSIYPCSRLSHNAWRGFSATITDTMDLLFDLCANSRFLYAINSPHRMLLFSNLIWGVFWVMRDEILSSWAGRGFYLLITFFFAALVRRRLLGIISRVRENTEHKH